MRIGILLLIAGAIFAVLSAGAQQQILENGLVGGTFAEGYTSHEPGQNMTLGYKFFTLYSRPCEGLPVVETVVAEPAQIELKVGERYFVSDLRIYAYDGNGMFVPRVPIQGASFIRPASVGHIDSDNDLLFWLAALGEGSGNLVFGVLCRAGDDDGFLRFEVPVVVAGYADYAEAVRRREY